MLASRCESSLDDQKNKLSGGGGGGAGLDWVNVSDISMPFVTSQGMEVRLYK